MKKIVILAIVAMTCVIAWYRWSLQPVDAGNGERISVRIEAGTSTTGIANALEERDLIRSPLAFRIFARRTGVEGKLQAGTFVLSPAMTLGEIIGALHNGKAQEIAVTIPEGFTVTDIDALLAKKNLAATGAFLRCTQECDLQEFGFLPPRTAFALRAGGVEGYLFPDTYFVIVEGFSTEVFLRRLLTTFRTEVIDEFGEEGESSGRSFHEILTMASLIEEEASTDAERPIIAGILWRRFDDGRGLGVDATVRYILEKPSTAISTGDLNVDSPYNTRKFRGLPPGPIANSGIKSIEAALHPTDSPYWYYLHDREGKIHYAVTNEEHNLNRIEYLNDHQ